LQYVFGIEEARSKKEIFLSLWKYALDMLLEAGMVACKPMDSPMNANSKLLSDQKELLNNLR